jgi:multidrug efflux pump subunit AcrB
VAKRKGANAVTVADDVLKHLETAHGRVVPDGVEIAVTRNYGETATGSHAHVVVAHQAVGN